MNVVLDTNVIVSAFLNPKGIPAEIVSLVLSEKIILCYDNKILSEYTDVLTRSKFNFNRELVNDFLEFIKTYGEYIVAESQDIQFIDEDDKIFYDVFRSSDTNYIITGNKKHYPKEKNILLPREFKEIR
ncbi:PIN domain-containing protein [Spirochaetia bacterium]|nr:PIN domain-containing protein [Spirochaetia bacterium]